MYNAIVTEIKTSDHPNADRLQMGHCHGFTVVVGKDIQDGEKGVFFPMDGALSHKFCEKNDLYPRFDNEGNRVGGGFIDKKNRRVKGQNFRGVKSEGFWVPMRYLDYLRPIKQDLKVGTTFTEIDGKEICSKYINPATLQAIKNAKTSKKIKRTYKETPMFPMVEDTKQLRYYISSIPIESKVYITEKLHGCVSAGTNIETLEYGNVTIKEMIDLKPEKLSIKSLNTDTGLIEYAEVSDYYFLENNGDWYEIELENGQVIEITGNNPVWLPEENRYIRVDELKGNEKLLSIL